MGVLLLSAYTLLLCEEVFHRHYYQPEQAAATLNDGTSHYAHGIIAESTGECAICQNAVSQIHTETFSIDPIAISFTAHHSKTIFKPILPAFYDFSLRAPPSLG